MIHFQILWPYQKKFNFIHPYHVALQTNLEKYLNVKKKKKKKKKKNRKERREKIQGKEKY